MDALERAAAELGIRAAKARYAQGVDSGDWELFASAFAENAVWDLRGWAVARNPVTGEWNGDNCSVGLELLESLDSVLPWPIEGRAAIKSAVEGGSGDEQLESLDSQHYVGFHELSSPLIKILTDTTAAVTWHVHDVSTYPEGAPFRSFSGFGFYHETYVKEDETWLIASCRISRLMCHIS